MRVLFLLDRDTASREHAMVRRVEVGLLDEGIQLTRCVPHACALVMPSGLIPQATYSDTGPRIALPWRADRLIRDLSRLAAGDDTATGRVDFDVVHAWGMDGWEIAAEIAEDAEASLVVEVSSAEAVQRAPGFERRCGHLLPEPGRVVFSVPDAPTRTALVRAGVKWPAREIPWGVFLPDSPRPLRPPGAPASVCVVGSGEDPGTTVALLDGLAELCGNSADDNERSGGILVFLDDRLVSGSPDTWRYAERLGLLSTVSIVPDLEGRREPVLRADIMAIPESRGLHRSITLDAIAAGVTVIAARDELCAELIDGVTAIVLDPPVRAAWASALKRAVDDHAFTIRLGQSARQHVATHRPASGQVRAVLELYERLTAPPQSLQAP